MTTTDLPEAPAYFPRDVALNRAGAAPLESLPPLRSLSPEDVERKVAAGALVLDTRSAAAFGTAHLPGATHMGLSGQFASWAGTLLSPAAPLVIVAESAEEARQAQVRLARVGMENVAGFLDGGVAVWDAAGRPLASTEQIAVDELKDRIADGRVGQLVDVRRPGEWNAGHIAGAVSIPLHQLVSRAGELDRSRPVVVICASGYRSSIATSLLQPRGFARATNVAGGMNAWSAVGAGGRSATGAESSKDRDLGAGVPPKL